MKKVLLFVSFVLCAATASFAEIVVAEGSPTFQSIDQNVDGFISPEEAASNEVLMSQFNVLDSDADGMLSESEFGNLSEPSY
jgi:hypothetical protein